MKIYKTIRKISQKIRGKKVYLTERDKNIKRYEKNRLRKKRSINKKNQIPSNTSSNPVSSINSANLTKIKMGFKATFFRIYSLTRKEMEVILNDKIALILLILFPISVILLANFNSPNLSVSGSTSSSGGMPILSQYSHPNIGFIDADNSKGYSSGDLSKDFAAIFHEYANKGEIYLYESYNRSQLEEMLGTGKINAYVIIDNGFEYNLSTHFVAMFTLVVDAYDTFVMQDVLTIVGNIVDEFKTTYNFSGAINISQTTINIPKKAALLRFMSPFFYPLIGFAMTLLIESQVLVNDIPKDRMILTPTKKGEILLSKFMGGSIVNSIIAIIIVLISLFLGLEIHQSAFAFFFVFETGVIIATSIGIFASSISKTTLAGFQYALLVIIVQEMLMLFITNNLVLSIFPLFCMQETYKWSILGGQPLFAIKNAIGIPYMLIIWIEVVLFYIG
ncbi:MAG: ABC transporter permease, partial [Promethearchaeota archaeon]